MRFPDFEGEWVNKKLGQIYKFKITNSLSRADLNYENGSVKNIHYGDIHTQYATLFDITKESVPYINHELNITKYSDENYCQEGDLIFADASEDYNDIGKCIEIVNLNNEKVQSGLHTLLARPEKSIMAIGFAGYLMKSGNVKLQIQREAQGTKVLSITSGRLSKIELLFTALPEQQKIASFFTAIDQKISQLKRKKNLLEQYKKGVMQKIFSQEIRFKDDNGQEFPKWEKKRLSEIFIEINETVGTRDIPTYSITAGVGFVSQNEKFGRNISGQQNKHYTVINEGQFSYNKGNSKTYTYGCIYVNDTGKRIAVPNVFISFEFIDQKMSSQFYSKLFESHYLDKGLRKIISSSARMDGLLNVNKNSFFQLSVPCPNYIEQQKIGHFLYSIDSKIFHIKNQIEKAEVWKKGLMQQMFV